MGCRRIESPGSVRVCLLLFGALVSPSCHRDHGWPGSGWSPSGQPGYDVEAGLRPMATSGLALPIMFVVAVMFNLVPCLLARFGARRPGGKVMAMIGSKWFGGIFSAAALVCSSVTASVIANAASV